MKLPDEILTWSPTKREVFFWLLSHADEDGKVVLNVSCMARDLGLTRDTARWALKSLTPKFGDSNTQSTPIFAAKKSLVIIKDIDSYGLAKNWQPPTNTQISDTQPPNLREKENIPTDREKEKIPPYPPYKEKEINAPQEEKERAFLEKEKFFEKEKEKIFAAWSVDSWGEAFQMNEGLCAQTLVYLLNDAYVYAIGEKREPTETTLKRLAKITYMKRRDEIRAKDIQLRGGTTRYEYRDRYGRYYIWGGDRYEIPQGASPRPSYNVRWDGARWVPFAGT